MNIYKCMSMYDDYNQGLDKVDRNQPATIGFEAESQPIVKDEKIWIADIQVNLEPINEMYNQC